MYSHLGALKSECRRRVSAATLIGALVAAALLLATSGAAAHGGKHAITGTLSKSGYTVIVLGYNGKAATSKSRSFKLKAPDAKVTLQLRDSHGKYAGPVIVGGGGSKVIVGFKPGAKLGKIIVLSGYARTAKPLPVKYLDKGRWAQARKGVPIGNGRNFGLVRSKLHNGPSGPGGDTSRTGVPNSLSIDPDGSGVIDALRPAGHLAVDAAAAPSGGPSSFSFFSQIFLDLGHTLNVDATGVTRADVDAMLPQFLNIVGVNVPTGDQVSLDCGGLSYCSAGGTGQLQTNPAPNVPKQPFPSCCDPSGDGFGNLRGQDALGLGGDGNPNNWGFFYPSATSSQVGSGDAFLLNVTAGGTVTQIPATLAFVFNTVPALASYDDKTGDSGTIPYPSSATAPGTVGNPIPLAARPSGQVVLTMKFWRPQRRGIAGAGEPQSMDIGHLLYTLDPTGLAQAAANPGSPPSGHPFAASCSGASLRTTDPNLTITPNGAGGYAVDSAADQPSDPANLLALDVDLTKCLTDAGAPDFPVGTQGALGLKAQAASSGDHAVQNVYFKRVS
jgi:hypothetical protein